MPYKNQGRYAEVEPLYQQALAMRQRLLGVQCDRQTLIAILEALTQQANLPQLDMETILSLL
jgi:hypothetical protein